MLGQRGGPTATVIRDVSCSELRLFGEVVARLERLGAETDARAVIFNDVIRLLRGDFGASYVWNARKNLFDEAVSFNMAPSDLRRYEEWYQFRDPMTFELRARRRATLVDEVIPRGKLVRRRRPRPRRFSYLAGEGPSGILYARSRSARCA